MSVNHVFVWSTDLCLSPVLPSGRLCRVESGFPISIVFVVMRESDAVASLNTHVLRSHGPGDLQAGVAAFTVMSVLRRFVPGHKLSRHMTVLHFSLNRFVAFVVRISDLSIIFTR